MTTNLVLPSNYLMLNYEKQQESIPVGCALPDFLIPGRGLPTEPSAGQRPPLDNDPPRTETLPGLRLLPLWTETPMDRNPL